MIDILFTDKTGTLTNNQMKLRKIAVDSTHILEVNVDLFRSSRAASKIRDLTPFGLLIEAMSVCHAVKPISQKSKSNDGIRYYSSSPDEVALIEALDSEFDL